MRFEEIDDSTSDLTEAELDIENKQRSNLFTWKGQFSPQFIETILRKYSNPSSVVYDPFLGSGTVLFESALLGLSAFGVELNPSAYLMAKFYEFINISSDHRKLLINKTNAFFSEVQKEEDFLNTVSKIDKIDNLELKVLIELIIVVFDYGKRPFSVDLFFSSVNRICGMLESLPICSKDIVVLNSDARNNNFKDNSANIVVTSPPYINVFNYHQNYRKSVELLGYNVLDIAKSELGSNRKNRGNRYLTVIQYVIDMALTVSETLRIVQNDSKIIFIVGRVSKVLGINFSNSKIIYRIFTEIFNISLDFKQSRKFKNRFGNLIIEDVLHFNSSKNERGTDEIIKEARLIGVSELEENLKFANSTERKRLIEEAIKRSGEVKESRFNDQE